MPIEDITAWVMLAALIAYVLLGGADFGGGVMDLLVATSRRRMGRFRAGWFLGGLGWLSTGIMAAATGTMVYVNLL